MNDSELLDFLQLSFTPGIGPTTVLRLLEELGDAGKVLHCSRRELQQIPNIGQRTSMAIEQSQQRRSELADELAYCRERKIHILCYAQPEYPAILREIPAPPLVLFCEGNLSAITSLPPTSLAVVGTRHPTLYGQRVTRQLVSKLTRKGFTIVSGLARGIDRVAHEAALDEYGVTIAVLGSGLKNIYPASHVELANRITEHGLIVSEVLPSATPHSRLFPRRNRIISGLSAGTLVIEAALRSGALITARHAMEQNREVMAVPGMIDTAVASGCNKLIKDGAQLVESSDDILDALSFRSGTHSTLPPDEPSVVQQIRIQDLSATEQAILSSIPESPMLIDMLEIPDGISTGKLLSTLTTLELKRFISRPTSNSVVKTIATRAT